MLISSASSSNVSISIEDPGGLRSLEAGGEIHHETGIPQDVTSPVPWAGSCAGGKRGDRAEPRAARRSLGRFIIEPSQLLPAAKQTNRKDISPKREEVSDLDCAV